MTVYTDKQKQLIKDYKSLMKKIEKEKLDLIYCPDNGYSYFYPKGLIERAGKKGYLAEKYDDEYDYLYEDEKKLDFNKEKLINSMAVFSKVFLNTFSADTEIYFIPLKNK